jgi:hypothetical protein
LADPVDELLRRYRPAGPPPELRAQVLDQRRAAATWPWAAAAAALLVTTVLLHAQVRSHVGELYEPAPDPRRAAVEELTSTLGGTDEARILAETIALHEQLRVVRTATMPGQESR